MDHAVDTPLAERKGAMQSRARSGTPASAFENQGRPPPRFSAAAEIVREAFDLVQPGAWLTVLTEHMSNTSSSPASAPKATAATARIA